jgi:hypothetical protein
MGLFEKLSCVCNERIIMYRSTKKVVRRVAATAAVGVSLAAGAVGVASAATPHATHAKDSSTATTNANSCVGGVVTAISATSITVQSISGTSTTYTINSATTFSEGQKTVTASSVVVGERVGIQVSSTSATTATSIDVQLAGIAGKVVSVSGNTITVTDPQGFTRTIIVNSSTTYTKSNAASTLSAVTVGTVVSARGTVDSNGTTLDASAVTIGQLGGPGMGGPGGPGGPGMGGPGGPGGHHR